MDSRRPDAEVHIDAHVVRALLSHQCPELRDEPLVLVDAGWDNVTYRAGAGLAVRLPRRGAAVPLLLNEQRWLPVLGPRLGVDVPIPVHMGTPAAGFPWPWSVVPWISGTTADVTILADTEAPRLAAVLKALHGPAPADAPRNPLRGVPLRDRADFVEIRIANLTHLTPRYVDRLRAFWREGLSAPEAEGRRWLHGDLHPRNVLVKEGRLSGIVDWGDMAGGDSATDLACAWTLLESEVARARFREAYGPSRGAWARGRAWAVFFGAALADSGEARHVPIGRGILGRLLDL